MRNRKHSNEYKSKYKLMAAASEEEEEDDDGSQQQKPVSTEKRRGSILGAVSLIVGTSIGSGILALPHKTSPTGFIPSLLFLVIETLLLPEINDTICARGGGKTRNQKAVPVPVRLEVISLRTMARETLGEWGGNLATLTYLFLAYTSLVAYTSKSGDVLSQLTSLPSLASGMVSALLLAVLILLGGTQAMDRVNQSASDN